MDSAFPGTVQRLSRRPLLLDQHWLSVPALTSADNRNTGDRILQLREQVILPAREKEGCAKLHTPGKNWQFRHIKRLLPFASERVIASGKAWVRRDAHAIVLDKIQGRTRKRRHEMRKEVIV